MKAMIFAAGVGSRLGELTREKPKCLMPIGGSTILEHVINRLKAAGVVEIAINLHHFPEQITDYFKERRDFGLKVHFSYEATLLNTGGGLKKVRPIFQDEAAFLVHNADIYSTYDLAQLVDIHLRNSNIATLGIMQRRSSRGLFFNQNDQLTGWKTPGVSEESPQKKREELGSADASYAFSGISICSGEIFSYMPDSDSFSIIESYLAAARASGRVFGVQIPNTGWVDIGTPERLEGLRKSLLSST